MESFRFHFQLFLLAICTLTLTTQASAADEHALSSGDGIAEITLSDSQNLNIDDTLALASTSVLTSPSTPTPFLAKKVKRHAAIQQCGKRLADAVKVVCRGHLYSGFSDLSRPRRSAAPTLKRTFTQGILTGPKPAKRIRRSITDECCKMACSDLTIAKYCDGGRRWNTARQVKTQNVVG